MSNATKGERTRAHIVAAAAPVFNRLGYAGTSMSELMSATGLEKGGLYRHFESKDALALAAFDHAVAVYGARYQAAVASRPTAVAQLGALLDTMAELATAPLVDGGCPLLNTAVESDDAHPALRDRARRAMRGFLRLVRGAYAGGVERGELRADVDPAAEATLLVATMEGAIMLARLFADPAYAQHAARAMRERAETLAARAPAAATRRAPRRPAR
jgi:AcrR family transcriptional regulator